MSLTIHVVCKVFLPTGMLSYQSDSGACGVVHLGLKYNILFSNANGGSFARYKSIRKTRHLGLSSGIAGQGTSLFSKRRSLALAQ